MLICSLLPSATEIVYALGLGDQLVAVTHECDYPEEARELPAITRSAIDHEGSDSGVIHDNVSSYNSSDLSIYALDQELLKELDPGLILTQELCGVCAVSYDDVQHAVRRLEGERTVLSLEPTSLNAILQTIRTVGQAAGVPERAAAVTEALQARVDRVARTAALAPERPRVFAMEWLDPPFIGGHWVPEMVRLAGGADGLGREGHPSVAATWDQVAGYDPDVVVLMPCGFHLDRNVEELRRTPMPDAWHRLRAVREGNIYAVDGSAYFNRPGPRIVDGLEIMAEILHPELFPRRTPQDAWRKLAPGKNRESSPAVT